MSDWTPEQNTIIADLAKRIMADPEDKKILGRLSKKHGGGAVREVEIEDIRDEIKRDLEQEKLMRQAEQARSRMEAQRQGLIESGRYSEDDVKEIEKIMESNAISDYEVAAKVYAFDAPQHQPKPESAKISSLWNLPKEKSSGIMADRNGWERDEARKAIDDLRKRR